MEHLDDQARPEDGAGAASGPIACRRVGPTAVLVLSGDLDLAGGDAVEATVAALVDDGVHDVSVQAQGVRFIDSSGLGGVLAARAKVVEGRGTFRFGPMSDAVARVVDLSGVRDLLTPAAT